MPRWKPDVPMAALFRREWYDDDRTAFQDCSTGVCFVRLSDGTRLIEAGANGVYAGGGTVCCQLDGKDAEGFPLGAMRRVGLDDPVFYPRAGAGPCGPDGAAAIKDLYWSYGPWHVYETDGSDWEILGDARDIQLLGDGCALWTLGGLLVTRGIELPHQPIGGFYAPRATRWHDRWVLGYQHWTGVLVLDGRVVMPPSEHYHYPDVRAYGTRIFIGWASSTADADYDFRSFTEEELAALPLIDPPLVPVIFEPFDHPVLIAPFKDLDGVSGAPAEIVVNQMQQAADRPCFVAEDSLASPLRGPLLGVYSESSLNPATALRLAEQRQTRLMLCHDSTSPWIVPAELRPWDLPAVELYLSLGETVTESCLRWVDGVENLLRQWPHDCALVPMFYCGGGVPPNEAFALRDVLDGLRILSQLVNLSPRIKVVAPFEWSRANGITAHPELRDAFASLLKAPPGLPVLMPVAPPPVPPAPSEPPPPLPPPVIQGDTLMLIDPTKTLIYAKAIVPHETRKGLATITLRNGRVCSCQPDGSLADRPAGYDGAYEACQISGNLATFDPREDGTFFTFGVALVDKL